MKIIKRHSEEERNNVYRFLNKKGEVIYIGHATKLKERLRSHRILTKEVYEEIDKIEFTVLKGTGDMFLAERYLISKNTPKYNRIGKEEVTITIKEFENLIWHEHENIIPKEVE